MKRTLLTERFPFLIPLRLKQRKLLYYAGMRLDKNRYATRKADTFPYELTSGSSLLINEHTGADIRYQYNKVHNLRLASACIDHVVIRPGETFSLWWLARHADRHEAYRDGLCVRNGKLVGVYGGGLCQLSNLLFWLFLHTPLTIVERHMHKIKEFPNPAPDDPCGVDATILEGWLDLRVRNDTRTPMQIELSLDEKTYYGRIRVPKEPTVLYTVENENLRYFQENGKTYESVDVVRRAIPRKAGTKPQSEKLYTNKTEIGYTL